MAITIGRGPRLEFVVRELPGKRKRAIHGWDAKKKVITEKAVVEPAGYMIYFPNGTCYRLSQQELVARGYDREPSIINFELVNDTKTPAGMFKYAQNEQTKKAAYRKLEDQVIRACKRRAGPSENNEESEHDAEAA